MQNPGSSILSTVAIICLAAPLWTVPAPASGWDFKDDRSTPEKLVESYYFAINNRLYAQAYSYFAEGSAPKDFASWAKGYAGTGTVKVKFGETAPDPGAGQIFWALPVALAAEIPDGTTHVFTGCYKIHMTSPGMQTDPPFRPMGIVSADLEKVDATFTEATPGSC